jgi:undecaprenyl phosphate-alpha-L-ara4FN deformylase
MNSLVLKVDVDTCLGTERGVPALLDLFGQFGVKATFLFSLGPDHTGRAIRRVFRKGFLHKVRRTSVLSHYGIRTLLYGVLLPGPHIGRRAGQVMRQAAAAGHEVGIHCYDHVLWQDHVAAADEEWTRGQMEQARLAFIDAVQRPPDTLGAAGWQLNAHVLALEEQMGFRYASDVRGQAPFFPVMDGVASRCMQIPTTLPTLDEVIGAAGVDAGNAHHKILQASCRDGAHGHVYTLHAELEGMKLMPTMRELLQQWQASGWRFCTLRQLHASLDPQAVPRKSVVWGEIEGRSGLLALEGPVPH